MKLERRLWTQEELLIVFRLYCHTPFGQLHNNNREIIKLSSLINRTPSAIAMKACNYASLDPFQKSRNIKGLGNTSRADKELWESFLNDSESIAEKSESAYLDLLSNRTSTSDFIIPPDESKTPNGPTEKIVLTKARKVQSFFRKAVLTSYENRCALTGLEISELLIASHVIPWSHEPKRRADPCNGICLNSFHDRAFDRGLISLDENLKVIISPRISDAKDCEFHEQQLIQIVGVPLRLPEKFEPDREAIKYHRENIFCL